VSVWEIARAYAAMGAADDAMRWLRRGIGERAPMTLLVRVHAAFAPIRNDRRFAGMLRDIGVPPPRATAAPAG
jgi:hypothetical protein